MARWSYTQKGSRPARRPPEPLPAPLPPETRTVGQLVAESIRAYGKDFWRVVPLGFPVAVLEWLAYGTSDADKQTLLLWLLSPAFAACFVWATIIVSGVPFDRDSAMVAFLVGVAVFIPFPLLARILVLPGLVYLGVIGLSVPAALLERLDFRDAFRRGFELGRADVVHSVGGLATLTIVFGVSAYALAYLLHGAGGQAVRVAATLGDLVLSPVVFLGSALLYFDQKARLELRA
jgi:hypothetical protein